VELALTLSGIALMILIFTIASKIAPIIPVAEMEEARGDSESPKDIFVEPKHELSLK